MQFADLIQLGDKIDIQLVQQLQMQERGELTEPIRTYNSSLFDYLTEKDFEIAMPTENGRMVLFQIGLRCKLLFYTKKGMYSCTAIVTNRYKKGNFYLLAMQITSSIEKIQRREFFRIEYAKPMKYIPITEDIAKLATTEQVFVQIQNPDFINQKKEAMMLDLSGGGLRFSSTEHLDVGSFVVVELRLTNDRMDQTFFLVSKIISSEPIPNKPELFVNRIQFFFKNLRDRENIVRFVFEEERRIRRKEMG